MDQTLWIRSYRRYVKPLLGRSASQLASEFIRRILILRVTPGFTRVLGLQNPRSRELIEIDITYICNLKCFNCNRSCEQQPTNDHMSVGQLRYFLEQSRARGVKWKRIRLVGGEPTIHPKFMDVVNLLLQYRDTYCPDTRIELTTNGYGRYVNKVIGKIPPGIEVHNSAKESQVQPTFSTFNVAPIDEPEYAKAEFANGCPITSECGIGLTPYGYYPCAIAGAIDRTFGLDLGRKELPDFDDNMEPELRRFCALCGHFKRDREAPVDGPVQSPVWRAAYARARCQPPRLSRFPEMNEPGPGKP